MKILFLFCVFVLLVLTSNAHQRSSGKEKISKLHEEELGHQRSRQPGDMIPGGLTLKIKAHVSEH